MADIDMERLAELLAVRLIEMLAEDDDRPLLSPRKLAERLDVSERTARQLLIDGVIPSFLVGESSRRVDPREVDRYLEGRRGDA